MIIKSFEIYKFQIPLKYPLKIINQEITNREGLILRLIDENGFAGVGEISPLPGLHLENIEQCIEQIKSALPKLIGNKISEKFEEFDNQINNLYPSVQFGIESAICSLTAIKQGISIFDLIKLNSEESIKINALLTGTIDQIIKKTQQRLKEGFTTLKLKVGRKKIEEDIELFSQVNNKISGKAKIRLDANQAWMLDEAILFFQNADLTNLEYIEEPLKNFEEIYLLVSKTNIPIALDENIPKIDLNRKPPHWLKAIVIKPTVIGGIQKSILFIRYAQKHGIKPVISDTFQSGVGLATLLAFANKITKNLAMGFDTYSMLKDDVLKNRFDIVSGKILYKNPELNYSKLEKLKIY